MKVVIIGGVAGGATAAARIRRLDERAEIVMLERTGYVSYANCGLPYYVGGTIGEEDALTLQTPQSFFARYRVDVRVGHEAVKIDRAGRRVTVRDLATGRTYEEDYDKLLLAPGAKPVIPAAAQTADAQRLAEHRPGKGGGPVARTPRKYARRGPPRGGCRSPSRRARLRAGRGEGRPRPQGREHAAPHR